MTTPGAGTARRRPSLVLVTIGVVVLIAALLFGAGALLAAHTARDRDSAPQNIAVRSPDRDAKS